MPVGLKGSGNIWKGFKLCCIAMNLCSLECVSSNLDTVQLGV